MEYEPILALFQGFELFSWGKDLDPDTHQGEKSDPDLHQIKIRIRIGIRVISQIRIESESTTLQNLPDSERVCRYLNSSRVAGTSSNRIPPA
jgi:hypothetical protein